MQQGGIPPTQCTELLGYPEFVSETTYQIVREKVLDYLVQNVKFVTAESGEAGGGEPGAAS